jgi:lipoprotein-anchoring transpeptidase ErfK/SrfK/glucan-binding YG repeat protein
MPVIFIQEERYKVKKRVIQSTLAAVLSVTMVFSGSAVSAFATEPTSGGAESGDAGKISLTEENTTVVGLEDKSYTGSQIVQEGYEVYYDANPYDDDKGELLLENVDYSVDYADNTDVGTAAFQVTGMGDYTGVVDVEFEIEAKALSADMVEAIADQTYTGSAIEPQLTVKNGEIALVKDTDYTVSYTNNTDIGTATATVTGTGNYTGSVNVNFTIASSVQNGVGTYNGRLAYFTNGKVDTSKNGLIQDPVSKNWYYFANGYVNTGYTNLVQYNKGWYYVKNGQIDWSCTTLAQVNGKGNWYYVEKGAIKWSYTGLVQYGGVWYYVKGGVLNWNSTYTGLTKYNGGWYYVEKSKLNWNYTGLVNHYGGWYYVEKGKLNWNYTNLVKYNGGWYYVQKGTITWKYTGLVQYYGGWYYVEKSAINWNYTGLVNHYGGWYYVDKGVINWNYTSLVKYNGGWYGVEKGKINWKLTTLLEYKGKGYYVKNGKVDWTYNGKATLYGTNKSYTVKNGVAELTSDADQMTQKVQSIASSTKYLLVVDRSKHRVGVFTGSKNNWTNVGYWECVVGSSATPTVAGQYTVGSKGKYYDTGSKGRCWYYTQITGNYRFHSVIYDRSSTPKTVLDGTMDAAKSDGCVRLSLSCAKYIYDNVPKGTKIYIY